MFRTRSSVHERMRCNRVVFRRRRTNVQKSLTAITYKSSVATFQVVQAVEILILLSKFLLQALRELHVVEWLVHAMIAVSLEVSLQGSL